MFCSCVVNFLHHSCFFKNLFLKPQNLQLRAVELSLLFTVISHTLDVTAQLFWLDLAVSSLLLWVCHWKEQEWYTYLCIHIYMYTHTHIEHTYLLPVLVHTLKKDYEKQWPDYFMLEIAVNCNVSLLPFRGYFSSCLFRLLSVLFHTPVVVFRSLLLIVLSSANFWVAVRRVVIQNRHPLCQSQCCDCF